MSSNIAEHSDSELFSLLKSDKRAADQAFEELYNRLSPRVYAYCRRFLGNKEEAQDVFQETFIKFYESSTKTREMTNVPAFLLKIARNLCVNFKRREKNNISFEDYMAVQSETRDDMDELLNLVKRALELLSDDYREIFILREYQGMSYSDIAKLTDVPLSTVKVRIFRAKQKIREILEPYLHDLTKDY